ncbi:MAG: hypothetical protein V1856_03075 [Candidatus Liptonbacteria bacterium]
MRKTPIVLIALHVLLAAQVAGAQAPDTQVRLIFHKRPTASGRSLVGWVILPDITAKNQVGRGSGLTVLAMFGMGWANESGWLELLVGSRTNQKGALLFEPTFNLRVSRRVDEWNLYGEVHLYPRGRPARTIFFASTNTRLVGFSAIAMHIGGEIEIINRFHGLDSWGGGPHVSMVLRVPPGIGLRQVAITVARQFRNDPGFTRWYVVLVY